MHRNLAQRLHGVGVKQDSAFPADLAQLPDGFYGSDFIVGRHDADQDGIRADGSPKGAGTDDARFIGGQIGDGIPAAFQILTGVKHCVMFDFAGDDMVSPMGIGLSSAFDGPIICFRTAAGEINIPLIRPYEGSDGAACAADGRFADGSKIID